MLLKVSGAGHLLGANSLVKNRVGFQKTLSKLIVFQINFVTGLFFCFSKVPVMAICWVKHLGKPQRGFHKTLSNFLLCRKNFVIGFFLCF